MIFLWWLKRLDSLIVRSISRSWSVVNLRTSQFLAWTNHCLCSELIKCSCLMFFCFTHTSYVSHSKSCVMHWTNFSVSTRRRFRCVVNLEKPETEIEEVKQMGQHCSCSRMNCFLIAVYSMGYLVYSRILTITILTGIA